MQSFPSCNSCPQPCCPPPKCIPLNCPPGLYSPSASGTQSTKNCALMVCRTVPFPSAYPACPFIPSFSCGPCSPCGPYIPCAPKCLPCAPSRVICMPTCPPTTASIYRC